MEKEENRISMTDGEKHRKDRMKGEMSEKGERKSQKEEK